MKRTLLTTLHFYQNYGSVLQAYALRTVLQKQFSFETDLFPYRPPLPEYEYFSDPKLRAKYREKVEKFDEFREKHLGLPKENADEIDRAYALLGRTAADYDAFLAGSDIIWGKEFSGLRGPYFLSHATGNRKIAYAASVILDENGQTENDTLFRERLSNFSAIGLRETSAKAPLQKLADDVPVEVVLDPTLLLDSADYATLEKPVAFDLDRPYLLSYFLTHDPAVCDYTNQIAKKLNLHVIHYFADYPKSVFAPDADCFAFTEPGEFLTLVRHAALIFTNSFHGTCFSMIYRKPFYTYMAKRAMLSRVRDTVSRLGMERRYFHDFRDLPQVTLETDYTDFEKNLCEEREQSFDFLRRALGGSDV